MCLFCKIINNEISSFKVFENDYVLAFLDISQETKGHTLVLPKKHIENIFELDVETSKHLAESILVVTNILRKKLHFSNMNILNNNGSLAGQTVNHLHIHLIPQYEDDHFEFNHNSHEPDFEKLSKLHEFIIGK